MHLNYKYFWRAYKLNKYIYKIYMYLLLRLLLERIGQQVYKLELLPTIVRLSPVFYISLPRDLIGYALGFNP